MIDSKSKGEKSIRVKKSRKRTRLKEVSVLRIERRRKNTRENSKPLVCKVYKRRRVLALCHPTNFLKKPKFTTHTLLLFECTNECSHREASQRFRRGVWLLGKAKWTKKNVQASERHSCWRVYCCVTTTLTKKKCSLSNIEFNSFFTSEKKNTFFAWTFFDYFFLSFSFYFYFVCRCYIFRLPIEKHIPTENVTGWRETELGRCMDTRIYSLFLLIRCGVGMPKNFQPTLWVAKLKQKHKLQTYMLAVLFRVFRCVIHIATTESFRSCYIRQTQTL